MVQNIVVIDGKDANPAQLETSVDPVRFDHGKCMAISSIMYGEINNIHEENNVVHFSSVRIMGVVYSCKIPIGTYSNTWSVAAQIVESIENSCVENGLKIGSFEEKSIVIKDQSSTSFNLELDGIIIHVKNRQDTPWNILGLDKDFSTISPALTKRELLGTVQPAILYVNIVESSYINGNLARNLAVIPLKVQKGYAYHEFAEPVYVPIEVKEFSQILLEIRGLDGKFIKFNPFWNTVITIRLKAINRS